jgi:hypothetical protein
MEEKIMDEYISLVSLIVAILALIVSIITPIMTYKKQKKDSATLNLKVIFGLSKMGAGKDYRYEYIVINNSHKTTYISEVYIEIYEFNQYIDQVRYVTQVDNVDEDEPFRNILPLTSVRGWIGELKEFDKANIYVRIAVYTLESAVFKSDFFDPRQCVNIAESKIKKLKKKTHNY